MEAGELHWAPLPHRGAAPGAVRRSGGQRGVVAGGRCHDDRLAPPEQWGRTAFRELCDSLKPSSGHHLHMWSRRN